MRRRGKAGTTGSRRFKMSQDITSLMHGADDSGATEKSIRRHIEKILKALRKNDRIVYGIHTSQNLEGHEDLTDRQEREAAAPLGRQGLSPTLAPRQKILHAF